MVLGVILYCNVFWTTILLYGKKQKKKKKES